MTLYRGLAQAGLPDATAVAAAGAGRADRCGAGAGAGAVGRAAPCPALAATDRLGARRLRALPRPAAAASRRGIAPLRRSRRLRAPRRRLRPASPRACAAASGDAGRRRRRRGRRGPPLAPPGSTMRSPSRSAAAPVVMTRRPRSGRRATSTMSLCSVPSSTARKIAESFERLEHAATSSEIDDRVDRHDERVLLGARRDADARVHAGLQAVRSVGDLDFDRRGARRRDRAPATTRAMRPLNDFAREGIHLDARRVAGLQLLEVLLDDVGDQTYAWRCPRRRRPATFCETNAPGSTARLATKPLTGELMMVLPRLMRSSSRRAFDCVLCALREIELRDAPPDSAPRCRRASAWAAAAARRGCASARRWSARASDRLRAAEWWPRDTSCAASACLTCSTISKSSIFAMR